MQYFNRAHTRPVEHVCTIARARGWIHVRWVTEPNNTAGRRLYDRIAENSQPQTYRIEVES